MKKIMTLLIIVFCVAINAQIKKPKVDITINKVTKKPLVQGLKVKGLAKMTSKDFAKLKIPVANITKEKLNIKATKKWSLNPYKNSDGFLKVDMVKGVWMHDYWQIGTGWGSDNTGRSILLDQEDFRTRNGDYNRLGYGMIFPFVLKFRASADKDYILKVEFFGNVNPRQSIFIGRESIIAEVNFDQHNEINYHFTQDRSGEFYIYISPIIHRVSSNLQGFFQSHIRSVEIHMIN